MKFSVERAPLLDALQKTQSVVEKRGTVQILSNILCTLDGMTLSLSATDLEVGVKVSIPVDGRQNGRVTLSAKNFLDIVKELPERTIDVVKKDNHWVEVTSGKSKFTVVSLSADEYPALPSFEQKEYLEARVDSLKEMIDKTSFAVSTDATRYHLNGVYFESVDQALFRMVATDGHRLSFVDQEVFLRLPDLKRGVIVPRKGLMELRRILDVASANVGLAFERGYLFCRVDETYLFVRLIDGEYPDYRQVIPKTPDKKVLIPREEFTAALKRVSLLAHEKSRGVKLAFTDNQLVVTSSNPDMGEAREELDIGYSGDSVEIGFNARYLLDCLTVLTGDNLEFLFKDRLSPGILRSAQSQNHTYVIMPMRI